MNPLTTRLRRLLPNLLPHLTCAKRVCAEELAASPACWPYIINETKKFLEKKKFQWPNEYTKCRVSDFLTRYYSTDRGIIETSLKTSFSRSLFSLFSPIPTEQIPAFPRKGKSPGEEVEQILHPGGVLSYMGYIDMCRCEGWYGFQAVYSRIGYINQSVWV